MTGPFFIGPNSGFGRSRVRDQILVMTLVPFEQGTSNKDIDKIKRPSIYGLDSLARKALSRYFKGCGFKSHLSELPVDFLHNTKENSKYRVSKTHLCNGNKQIIMLLSTQG